MKRHHTVARVKRVHTRSGLHHNAGGLMSKDARRREQIILDLFEICVADTAGFDAYE
jgi:hypothetical protein